MDMSRINGKKVKILESLSSWKLEELISDFLQECESSVWNIQYQIAPYGHDCTSTIYSALIIYD